MYSDCSSRVIVLFLIVSPNSFKISLTNTLAPWSVLNLCNEIDRDVNGIIFSMVFDYKTELQYGYIIDY